MTTDPELLGRVIDGRYRVVDRIGRGGMGSVFRVQHVQSHEWFALKVLHADVAKDRMMVERFVREARAATAFRSKHVVKVVDAQRDHVGPDGAPLPYLVMELLVGKNVEQVVTTRGPLPKAEVAWMFQQLGKALDAAHEHGIVHRDLKPENVFVALDEDGDSVTKVCDFGIAKLVGESAAGLLATGALDTRPSSMGTPMYMSPEQIRDASAVDARTDQWALGLIAYKALSGKEYFGDARSSGQLIAKILADPIVAPSTKWPSHAPEGELGEAFDVWFLRSCAREPADRWPSVGAQVTALREALGVETLVPMSVPKEAMEIESAVTGAKVTPSVDRVAAATGAPSATTNRVAGETALGRRRMVFASVLGALVVIGGVAATRFVASGARAPDAPAASGAAAKPIATAAQPIEPAAPLVSTTAAATTPSTIAAPSPTAAAPPASAATKPIALPTPVPPTKPKSTPTQAPPVPSVTAAPTVKAKLPKGAPCTRMGECASGYCFAEQCQ